MVGRDRKSLLSRRLLLTTLIWSMPAHPAAAETPAAAAIPPAVTYAHICGYCHGANVGPIILGQHLPAETIKAMVRSGPHAMPAFRPTEISDADLDALARWIEASPSAGQEHGQ